MSISKMLTSALLSFFAVTILLFTVSAAAQAQTDSIKKKRLQNPATVHGFIGGESHDSYVIRARKGQTLRVQISWQRKGDNQAEFTISKSADFFNSEPVKFGKESDKGKTWIGKIPVTGDYYIYVVAHPTAKYTLSIKSAVIE